MSVGVPFVQMMAAYNAEMNRRLYEAAARLPDEARRQDRGAFWHSIHGTLAHLVWGDRQWMSRFDGWAKNSVPLRQSAEPATSFEALRAERAAMDADIEAWAARVEQSWLDGDLVWFSGAAGREVQKPLSVLVPHFFNHQTHHRGQVHAMITAAGEQTGDTDLFLLV
jgi:uncharacterized damage-inducible protein DinB